MAVSARLVYSQETPTRRALSEVFSAAAEGRAILQPHADGDLLITEAFIAQETLRNIGRLLRSELQGTFEIGPAKDLARATAKTAQKQADLAANCDFSRARFLLRDVEQIKKAIDMFGKIGRIEIGNGEKKTELTIVDVDNTFSRPSSKKPGLRNLDIKVAVPITLESGEKSYHICELQFLHKGAKKAYTQSHAIYEEARRELSRRMFIENAMDIAGCPETARSLEKAWKKADTHYSNLMTRRGQLNVSVAHKLGLDELTGYLPCETGRTNSLQRSRETIYEVR